MPASGPTALALAALELGEELGLLGGQRRVDHGQVGAQRLADPVAGLAVEPPVPADAGEAAPVTIDAPPPKQQGPVDPGCTDDDDLTPCLKDPLGSGNE